MLEIEVEVFLLLFLVFLFIYFIFYFFYLFIFLQGGPTTQSYLREMTSTHVTPVTHSGWP